MLSLLLMMLENKPGSDPDVIEITGNEDQLSLSGTGPVSIALTDLMAPNSLCQLSLRMCQMASMSADAGSAYVMKIMVGVSECATSSSFRVVI